jgi:hypothetical protein
MSPMRDSLAVHIPTFTELTPSLTASLSGTVHNGTVPASRARHSPDPTISTATATDRAAARGYNQLVFEGRLAEDPALRQAGTGRLYCRVAALQDQPDRNGQAGAQAVDVVCFDERATRFAERFRRGDYAVFIGRMAIERHRDQEGQFHMNVSLHLERVLGHRPARRA